MDFVITACDTAAQQIVPCWPGSPVQIHWAYPAPFNVGATDAAKRAAFESTRQAIGERMQTLAKVPFDSLSDTQLRTALDAL